MRSGLLTAWLAAVALITYRGVKQTPRVTPLPMPLPSTYVSSFIVFGGLGLIPESGAAFAGAMGWAFVLAIFLNLWVPGKGGTISVAQPAAAAPAGTPTTTATTTKQKAA
jgi:hypothetical protein